MISRILTVLLILLSLFLGTIIPEKVAAKEENEKSEVINQINQISFGYESYHVLGRDGSIWGAGFNPYGGLGWSGNKNQGEIKTIPLAKSIVATSANLNETYGVTKEGAVLSWKLGYQYEYLTSNKHVKDIVTGLNFGAALTAEGTVWAWGGLQVGDSAISKAAPIPGLDDVVEIECNALSGTIFALKKDGSVWGIGSNNNYQLGTSGDKATVPVKISLPVKIKHIYQSNGKQYGAAIDENNSVWWWGKGYPSEVKSTIYGEPVLDPSIKDVKQLALGKEHALALKNDGSVLAWGKNSWGQLGNGKTVEGLSPEPVPGLKDIYSINAGSENSAAVSNSSDVYIWGKIYGIGSIPSPKLITINDQPSEVLPVEKPLNLKLKVTSANSVQLSWDHERQNDWDRYNIYQNNQMIQTTKDKTITIGNLDPNKEYNFYVTTKGILGQESEASNTVKKRGIEKYSYIYNSSGQLTSILYESGKKITYEYDKNGNLKKTTVVNP
ncbi:hypothetical protein HF638_19590 [Paenibacillus sp. SZ31]|uniref:fibronectin type III domain-containing protein n=1 Tax=Paenibacillus sp. SZ31 TaxID=2725555 RepID=UPI00146DDD47|nr:fibronectin type III domain-containing protein [Paenibacillus sp. SZ31]NMI06186.1 hypothetical protein [Paenibacillus sp. SZ31]